MLHTSVLMLLLSGFFTGPGFEVETTAGGFLYSDQKELRCRETEGNCVLANYKPGRRRKTSNRIILNAVPDDGYQLSHWEGDCVVARYHRCLVILARDLYVKAHFSQIEYAEGSAPNKTVRFVALGDMGEGNAAQYAVSAAIEAECDAIGGCDFAIGLGDNIYDVNPLTIYHPVFVDNFELPYQNLNFPFFMSLGNHDNDLLRDGTGGFNHAGDVQVRYTFKRNKLSQKWQLPDRYYHYSAPLSDASPLIDFFVLDSNPMTSAPDIAPKFAVEPYQEQQKQWFDTVREETLATWKFAYSHHPYISNGKHGNAGFYDDVPPITALGKRVSGDLYRRWLEETICGKVDVYLSGHDHDLQLLKSVPECGNTLFVVSGAGAKARPLAAPSRSPSYWQLGETPGFFLFTITGNIMNIKAFSVNAGDSSHELEFDGDFPRRSKQG